MQTEELAVEETLELQAEPIEETIARLQRPVEALLFVASEPLSIKQIAKLTRATEIQVAATLQKVEADFNDRGVVLREIGGGYRFASAPLARDVVEAYLLPPKTNLSTPALETLAIIAYLQPVTKSEIEAIRGVSAESVVSTLLDRRLVAEAGRKDVVGRPMLYKTTADFLEAFGLRSLEDLPQMELEAGQPLELELLTAAMTANVPENSEVAAAQASDAEASESRQAESDEQ
ncbi:MAG: SMC-Scp complex subunit ScpB [Candidatus Eremiobacteraeota bacterium]|nr:SMC-Scp complex subunit ScpB [Candidatus Eremiobacteraeota bacterium]